MADNRYGYARHASICRGLWDRWIPGGRRGDPVRGGKRGRLVSGVVADLDLWHSRDAGGRRGTSGRPNDGLPPSGGRGRPGGHPASCCAIDAGYRRAWKRDAGRTANCPAAERGPELATGRRAGQAARQPRWRRLEWPLADKSARHRRPGGHQPAWRHAQLNRAEPRVGRHYPRRHRGGQAFWVAGNDRAERRHRARRHDHRDRRGLRRPCVGRGQAPHQSVRMTRQRLFQEPQADRL